MQLKFAVLLAFLFTGTAVMAQRNFTMYSLNETAQSHYLNPAFRPKAKVFISLPLAMQSFGVSNSGFTVNNLLKTRSQDDSLVFRPDIAIGKMGKLNYLTAETYNEIIGIGFVIKKNYFSLSIANRFQTNMIYPKDLFKFALEGNGKDFLGQRASIDGFGVNVSSYVEYALGFNRKINDKLTVGGRIKLLSGIANVATKKSKLGIYTDAETFNLTIDGSASVYTSNVKPFYDTLADDNYNPLNNAYNFRNFGFAVDLGGTYKLNDKIDLSASLLDLGMIKWKTNTANFVSNDVNYTFEGVDLNQFLKDSTSGVFDQLTDTLKNIFNQQENADTYSTGLYTRFYLGGTYKLNEKLFAGATLYNEFIRSRYRPGLILSANAKLNNWLAATVNYSMYARSFTNIGLGFSLRGGPIQFYAVSDNVLGFLAPKAQKNFHVSFGLNILIGNPDKVKTSKSKFG